VADFLEYARAELKESGADDQVLESMIKRRSPADSVNAIIGLGAESYERG
jgi:hypothetical protein